MTGTEKGAGVGTPGAGSILTPVVPAASPLTDSPSLMVAALGRVVGRRLNDALAELGLSLRSLGALGHLRRQPDISYTELARRAGVTVQSMHATIAQLIALGAVAPVEPTARGRSAQLTVTDRGVGLLGAVGEIAARVDEEIFADATPEVATLLSRAAAAAFAAGRRQPERNAASAPRSS